MDIMELGAIGELVGGVAVIASLIYVAVQIRQNSEQTRQANLIERARANREVVRDFNEIFLTMRDPEAVEIYGRAMSDFGGLSTTEKGTLDMYLGPLVLHAISAFLAARDELMESASGGTTRNSTSRRISSSKWIECSGVRGAASLQRGLSVVRSGPGG